MLRYALFALVALLLVACPSNESLEPTPDVGPGFVVRIPIDTSLEPFPRNPATLVAVWMPYADSMPSHAVVFGVASASREYSEASLPIPRFLPDSLLMRAGTDSLDPAFYRFGAAIMLLFDDPNGVLKNGYRIPLLSIGDLPDGLRSRGYVSNAAVVYRHDPASALMARYPWMESFVNRYTVAVGTVGSRSGEEAFRPREPYDTVALTIDSTGDGFVLPGWMP